MDPDRQTDDIGHAISIPRYALVHRAVKMVGRIFTNDMDLPMDVPFEVSMTKTLLIVSKHSKTKL